MLDFTKTTFTRKEIPMNHYEIIGGFQLHCSIRIDKQALVPPDQEFFRKEIRRRLHYHAYGELCGPIAQLSCLAESTTISFEGMQELTAVREEIFKLLKTP